MTEAEEVEGLLALGVIDCAFAGYAAGRLLSLKRCDSFVKWNVLVSCFARGDVDKARKLLDSWAGGGRPRSAWVSKFTPGSHYYTCDHKFDTLEEALDHIREAGMRFAGLKESHVYREE